MIQRGNFEQYGKYQETGMTNDHIFNCYHQSEQNNDKRLEN